jgi:hypothetical protein
LIQIKRLWLATSLGISCDYRRLAVSENKLLGALAAMIVLGVPAIGSATLFESERDNGRNSGKERGGYVSPCSLNGVNPAYHPEIFGNPAVARSYGFVRSRDGTWQVSSGCRH